MYPGFKEIMNYIRAFFLIFILIMTAIAGGFFYIIIHYTVDFSALAHYNPGHPSILLDDEGKEWARFALDRRDPICFDMIPVHLRNAFIAAEDWQFFSHAGISWKGIARSLVVNVVHGKKLQGASTITQQLVKLLFFDSQKTFKRKIKEQIYALLVENQFTKEQILETYLNHVYFGYGIYGVQAASQRFWGKDVMNLSLDECATLAAIIKSPAYYSPISAPFSVQQRRNTILHSMQKLRFITHDEYLAACKIPVQAQETDHTICAPHLKELIRQQLEEEVGKAQLYTGGLIIQTTLNRHIQQLAQESFETHMRTFKKEILSSIDGALLTIDTKTGDIKAMVGGFDFSKSKFNRAWQARRQIGSVFKPLIYAAAIQHGACFAHTHIDEPITVTQDNALWQPNNYNNRFEGQMTLAYALYRSNNIVAVKTLLQVGMETVIELAARAGIHEQLHAYPSLALGCIDATLKEVTGMFNIFANNGIYVAPHTLLWVKDEWGAKIYKPTIASHQVLDDRVVGQVAKVLELSAGRLRPKDNSAFMQSNVICKTGTTNDCRVCWFAGSTPELTTVVYVAADDNRSLGDVYPVKTAFPIWLGLHSKLTPTDKKFTYHPALKRVRINQWTGRLAYDNDPDGIEILV